MWTCECERRVSEREGEKTYEALQISRRQRTVGVGEQCMPGDQIWDECQTRAPRLQGEVSWSYTESGMDGDLGLAR